MAPSRPVWAARDGEYRQTPMSVRIACGLSTAPDPRTGAIEAAAEVARELEGATVDLAVVFASGAHLADPEATLAGVHEALAPDVLIGCGAGGVVGAGREIEGGTAVSVWAAAFENGFVSTFHAEVTEVEDGVAVAGVPDLQGAGGALLLPDPYSFPTDAVLAELAARAPRVPFSAASPARARCAARRRCSSASGSCRAARSACASTGSSCCRASRRARPRSAPSSRSPPARGG